MTIDLAQIDLMACPFTWGGTKICYLSRGKLRVIAKQIGVAADGVKMDIYNRIVMHLEAACTLFEEIGSVIELAEGRAALRDERAGRTVL